MEPENEQILSGASYRETWAEISLDAIKSNVRAFKHHIGASCRFMAVVKSDGYGHGAVEVSEAALEAGADYIGVAFLDEALELRKAGIDAPILVLGYTAPEHVETAVEHDVALTVYARDVADEIVRVAERASRCVRVHLKVDTGMSRIGVKDPEAALRLALSLDRAPNVRLEGLYTHFADADSADPTYTEMQFRRFQTFIRTLEREGVRGLIKHCCNSAGTMQYPKMHLDMVRVGISLYGLYPSDYLKSKPYRDDKPFPLIQAMHLKTRVSDLRRLEPGEAVSYGCTFKAKRATRIATVPVGYADGYSRIISNKASALLRGTRVPVVGRVCMDQTMLDVTDLSDVKVGDEVILYGGDEKAFLSIDEIAAHMGTINYEVVCILSKRVPRIYIQEQSATKRKNALLDQVR